MAYKRKTNRPYIRTVTLKTKDKERPSEAAEADVAEKTAQLRAENAVNGTVSGMKDPSFWK
jgi:hypothetical protein